MRLRAIVGADPCGRSGSLEMTRFQQPSAMPGEQKSYSQAN